MSELYHHGIIGQKWGVRRFQNADGTYTSEGKRRRGVSSNSKSSSRQKTDNLERNKKIATAVGVGLLAVGTVAAATVYVKNHPEVAMQVAGMSNVFASKVSDLSATGVANGKNFAKRALQKTKNAGIVAGMVARERINTSQEKFREGMRKGFEEAPEKLGKAIIVGAAMNLGKRALDMAVGKEEAAKIMQANNSKKIDKFWKVNDDRDKDDKEDD